MTQTVYPFDPHGTNVACYIKNEANSLLSSFGTHRCVIPKAAPFYKKDFVITSAGVPLKEGKDFYFGHQYVRGTHQTAQAIYGSIYIINDKITLPLVATYRSLGGQYTVLDAVITAYLANSLTDPTTARWEDVCGELFFPPVDIAYDIDNWNGEAELITAINDVGTAIESQDPLNNESVNAFENWIQEEERIVNDSNWPAHLADTGSSGGAPTPDTGTVVNYLYSQEWGTFQSIFGQGETPGTAFNWIPDNTGNFSYDEDGGSWLYDSFNNFLFNDISTAYNSVNGTPYGDDNTTFNKSYCGVVNSAPSYYTANVHFAPVTDYINDADSAAANYTYGSPGLVAMVLRNRWDVNGEPQQLSVIFSPDGGKRNSLGLYENTVSLWYNYGYSDGVCIAGVRGNLNIPEMSTSFEGIPGFNILVNLQPDVVRITIYVFVTDYHSFTFEIPVPDIEVYYPDITDGSFGIGAYRQPYVYVTDNMLQEDVWEVTTVGTDNTYGFVLDPNHDTMGSAISYIGPSYGFAYNYDQPANYRDMAHWNIEWYDDKPTLVLESLYRIVNSDTIACQSTDDGYTANYSGKLTDKGYTFYQLKTPLSAGSGTFYMWHDFGQPMDIQLAEAAPGVAGIVVKYQPGEQLDLIIDPDNTDNQALQLWYNYNQTNARLICAAGTFEDGYNHWDTIDESNPMRLTIDFLPDGLHVFIDYGEDHAKQVWIDITVDDIANAVFDYRSFVVDSKIGFGGHMQPFIEYAGQWIKEYGYTYNEPSQPTGHGSNPHNTLWYQAGALKSDGVAQNANAITSLTIDQLASEVAAQQNVHPERYFPLNAPREITGDLILKDGLAHIARYAKDTTGENESFIQLGSGNSQISGDRNLTIAADKDKTTPGAVATLQSGSNILKVVSSGSAQEADKLFFNDQLVLTSATLQNHLPMDSNASLNVVTQSTTTMTFSGKGSTVDPLKVTINYPLGSTSVKGIVKLTSALDNSHPTYAGTPLAVKTLNDRLSGLIPTTRTVNNLALNKSIVITASMLGINNIDNITDANLPVNAYYQTELDKYSPAVHSHASTEFSLTHATNAVLGIVKYAYNLTGTDNALALSSYVYNDLASRLSAIENQAYLKVPANALKMIRYGSPGYLPIPAIGSYEASGPNITRRGIGLYLENDNTFVILRNGSDIDTTGVFYAYSELQKNGTFVSPITTTSRYRPRFLAEEEYISYIYRNSESAMVVRIANGDYEQMAFVVLNGTFDGSRHDGCYIDAPEIAWNLDPNDQCRIFPFVHDTHCYIIVHRLMETNAFINVEIYQASLSAVVAGGVVTFTKLNLTGKDIYGTDISGTKLQLITNAVSANLADKPFIYRPEGGWSNGLHSDCAATGGVVSGDKVRMLLSGQMLFSVTNGNSIGFWGFTYVVDLSTLSVLPDVKTTPPVTINPDFTTSGECVVRTWSEKTFGTARWDNEIGGVYVKNRWLTFCTHSADGVYVGTDSDDQSGTAFDHLTLPAREVTPIEYSRLIMKFGSQSEDYLFRVGVGANNTLIVGNKNKGNYFKAEYVLNGDYIYTAKYKGFGPTDNRMLIDHDTMAAYKYSFLLTDGNTSAWAGSILMDDRLSVIRYPGSALTTSVTTLAWNALKNAASTSLSVTPIDARGSLMLPSNPMFPVTLLYEYSTPNGNTGLFNVYQAVFEVTTAARVGDIGTVTLGKILANNLIQPNAHSFYPVLDGWNSSGILKLADGRYLFLNNAMYRTDYVGWSSYYGFYAAYDVLTKTWSPVVTHLHDDNWEARGLIIVPRFGLVGILPDTSATAILARVYGNDMTNITNGTISDTVILHSSQVLSSWNVYLTEPVTYLCNGVRYTLPAQTMDIRSYFPGDYQNRTFYLYADVQNGAPVYVWTTVKNPDSGTATYIGYCVTNATRVSKLSIARTTRLGDFRELVNHRNSLTAHGIGNNTKESIGLSQVANKAPAYTLKTSAFSDVFNTWLRFSHLTSSWAQPALAGEANAWVYDAATDSIKCTQNTTTYVGFISPTKIADYEFDTVVGLPASSVDGDNDVLAIVIGYIEISGVQHTLSVLRTNNIDQGAAMAFETQLGVYYDYQLPDQKTVAKVDTSASETPSIWRGKYSRIFVKRVGDTFTIKATKIDANTWATVTDSDYIFTMTFTLNDLPELAIFKGPTQYGYGAYSQVDAQFINYLRPDLDGRNFYATTTEVLKAAYWQQNAVIQSGRIDHGATLPIPAGLTRAQCKYYVFPGYAMVMMGTTGWSAMSVSYDPNTFVVNGTVRNLSGVNKPINLNYVVLATPGFKLLK